MLDVLLSTWYGWQRPGGNAVADEQHGYQILGEAKRAVRLAFEGP
jgi:hypothetical protein